MIAMFNYFKYISKLEEERVEEICNGVVSNDRTNLPMLYELFLKHADIVERDLIPLIKKNMDSEEFCKFFIYNYLKLLKVEMKEILYKLDLPENLNFYCPQLEQVQLRIDSAESIKNFVEFENSVMNKDCCVEYYNGFYRQINGCDGTEFIVSNLVYIEIANVLYKNFDHEEMKAKRFYQNRDEIVELFNKQGIDILAQDEQLNHYNLLSYSDSFNIFNTKGGRYVYHAGIKKYFWIAVPRFLLKCLEQCIVDNYISKIAFKVDGITTLIPALEDLEFGRRFTIDLPSLPEKSKFYDSDDIDNGLWIKHELAGCNLTFEETCSDFECDDENIVTQVLHLQYKTDQRLGTVITHLDHEYIFYSIEEYELRVNSQDVKGESKKRVKTFKIDNSSIPFDYIFEEKYFLYICLDCLFVNKKLVREYFEQIL